MPQILRFATFGKLSNILYVPRVIVISYHCSNLLLLPLRNCVILSEKEKEMTSRPSTKRLCTKIDKNVQGTFGSHCKVVYMLQAYSGEFNDSETR